MRAELTGLSHCAVPFLSRTAANLCWYYYTQYSYSGSGDFCGDLCLVDLFLGFLSGLINSPLCSSM